jgi:hypothetical protein
VLLANDLSALMTEADERLKELTSFSSRPPAVLPPLDTLAQVSRDVRSIVASGAETCASTDRP